MLYGGQAGGGKSDALLFGALRQIDHPDYKALILRRTFPELRELVDRSLAVFPETGATWNERDHRWAFPSGATYQFGYCGTYAEAMQYQGQQFTTIAFDELGQLPEERIWLFLMSRNRTASAGLVRMMRASANPGGPGHAWIKRRFVSRCPNDGRPVEIVPENGGAETTTRAFVKATLRDNPTLMVADPGYEARLRMLPELEYRWLAMGDWDAGVGLGLADLSREKHLVYGLDHVPRHWTLFAAFDWGYHHPFYFGVFACDEGGTVYLLDAITGRHLQPPDIVFRVLDRLKALGLSASHLRYTAAGHDCWADHKARGEHVPTIAEHFATLGLPLVRANISRVAGVQNIRRYLNWKLRDQLGEREIPPRFQICDTLTNRRVYDCLESRVSDPDDPEDILKTDADDRGEGGDDAYDMVRYGLASRPLTPAMAAEPGGFKVGDRAPHFDIAQQRLVRVTPAAALNEIFQEWGRPKNAAPFTHAVPTWRRPVGPR